MHVPAVRVGHGERRLGLEEGVLDALGLEHLVHHVGAGGQRRLDVAPLRTAERDSTFESVPHTAISGSSMAATGSVSGRQHVVVDVDQRGGGPGLLARVGHHDGEHVAGVRRRPPTGIITGQSLWMSPTRSSPGMSAAVNTATTPGAAAAAGGVDGA